MQDSRGPTRAFPESPVCGVGVARITVDEFIDYVCTQSSGFDEKGQHHQSDAPLFITYMNAACSNISADDPDYLAILRQSHCVYADGQAVVWAAKFLGYGLPERVNAGDFIIDFCRRTLMHGIPVALMGGRDGVAGRAADAWKAQVPGLKIAGTWSGFFEGDGDSVAEEIRRSGAGILLVGMGVPLQEKWAWAQREKLGVRAIWCVGALFEYYGENRPRAPIWMRRAGLEWLFRLALEPRRLWHRYLVGNVRFVYRVLRESIVGLR